MAGKTRLFGTGSRQPIVNDNAESGNGNILAHPMKSYIDSQIDIKS